MFRRASLEEIYRNVDIIGLLLLLLLEAAFEPQLVRGGEEGAVMPGRVDMIFYFIYFLEKIKERKEKGYG